MQEKKKLVVLLFMITKYGLAFYLVFLCDFET